MTSDSEDLWLNWPEAHLFIKLRASDVACAMEGKVVLAAEASKAKGSWRARLRIRFQGGEGTDGRWEARLASGGEAPGGSPSDALWSRCFPATSMQLANLVIKPKVEKPKAPKADKPSKQPLKPRRGMGRDSSYRRILASVAPDVFVDISTHPVAESNGVEIYAGTRIPARIVALMRKRENPGIRENWNETPITLLRTDDSKRRNAHWYWIPSHPPILTVWEIPIAKWKRAGAFEIIKDPFRWVDPRTLTPGVRKDPWVG